MIPRALEETVHQRLRQFPAVALLGPRQSGKTTLAREIAKAHESVYLDLESASDREKLADPAHYLSLHRHRLVVLDEVHRTPGLFRELRDIIDRARRSGRHQGLFLFVGSAAMDLLEQSSENLDGRIASVELGPFDLFEVPESEADRLWVRGGFPGSFLAPDDQTSLAWRKTLIRTYLERDIPAFGPRIPAETLGRFWTMLAHSQGGILNAAQLARSLAVDGKTVARYLDLLEDLLLVRRLAPLEVSVGKRLVKSPKIYLKDSGIVHALLGIGDLETLLGHPVLGGSWEGFVIDNLLRAAPEQTRPAFYRTAAGAEMDLVLELAGGERWAVEIKRGLAPRPRRGFTQARADLTPHRTFVVYSGSERFLRRDKVEFISLHDLCRELSAL